MYLSDVQNPEGTSPTPAWTSLFPEARISKQHIIVFFSFCFAVKPVINLGDGLALLLFLTIIRCVVLPDESEKRPIQSENTDNKIF